jgi:hypothetical protein
VELALKVPDSPPHHHPVSLTSIFVGLACTPGIAIGKTTKTKSTKIATNTKESLPENTSLKAPILDLTRFPLTCPPPRCSRLPSLSYLFFRFSFFTSPL